MADLGRRLTARRFRLSDEAREKKILKWVTISACCIVGLVFFVILISSLSSRPPKIIQKTIVKNDNGPMETPPEIKNLGSQISNATNIGELDTVVNTCYELQRKYPLLLDELEVYIKQAGERKEDLKKKDMEDQISAINTDLDRANFRGASLKIKDALDKYRLDKRLLDLHSRIIKSAWDYVKDKIKSVEKAKFDDQKKVINELIGKFGSETCQDFIAIRNWLITIKIQNEWR